MRKLSFTNLMAVSALLGASFLAVSCSDDDDKGGALAPKGPTAIYDGNLLTRAGDYVFTYDDNGRCVSAREYGSDLFVIDYERGKIIMDDEEYNVSFTRNGYISRVSYSVNMKDEGYTVKINADISMDYDGDGHIISGVSTFNGSASGPEGSFNERETSNAKMTWKNGNMIKVVCKESIKDVEGTEESQTTVNIQYSDVPNVFNQWTFAQEKTMLGNEAMGFAGLDGRGTANLVSSYEEVYEEEGRIERHTTNASYVLNDNGTIRQERLNRETYNYSYSKFDNGSQKIPALTPENKTSRPVGIFSDMRNKVREFRAKYAVKK